MSETKKTLDKDLLRKQAGIVITEAQEAMGTTHLLVELRSLAHQWSQGDNGKHECAQELLALIEKHKGGVKDDDDDEDEGEHEYRGG